MKDLEGHRKPEDFIRRGRIQPWWWEAERPLASVGAQMSTAYLAATQMLDREVMPRQFRSDMLERDELWGLVDKIMFVQSGEDDNGRIGATKAEIV